MSQRFPGWGAALRIARREARFARARSLLVVALIGLPVLLLTVADIGYRTWQLDPTDQVAQWLGPADAAVRLEGGHVQQTPTAWHVVEDPTGGGRHATPPSIRAAVPGTVRIGAVRNSERDWQLRTPLGLQQTSVLALDLRDPLARGGYVVISGRAPRAADELAVTTQLAAVTRLSVGDSVGRAGSADRFRVVGVVADPSSRTALTAFVPQHTPLGPSGVTYYLRTRAPVGWDVVRSANSQGWDVLSRSALLSPPPPSQWTQPPEPGGAPVAKVGVIVVFGLALLEVVLLAGPAFAVAARRRSRDLALLAAVGGTRRQLARVVLADAVVLGSVSGVAAVVLGLLASRIGLPLFADQVAKRPGHFDARPPELAALVALAVLTALAAALLPARRAARVDVVAALNGRQGQLRSSRAMPVLGTVLAVLGVGLAGTAAATSAGAYRIIAGVVLLELGLIAVTPTVIGAVTRVSSVTALPVRMALRDTGRNRSSAASAVAAVMAAVVGAVALAVGLTTVVADRRAQYQRQLAADTAFVRLTDVHQSAGAVRAAVRSALPGAAVHVLRGPSSLIAGVAGAPYADVFARNDRTRLPAPVTELPQTIDGSVGTGEPAGLAPGALADRVRAALRDGDSVAFVPRSVRSPDATAVIAQSRRGTQRWGGHIVTIRTDEPVPALVLAPSLAHRLRAPVVPLGVFATTRGPVTGAQQQAADAALYSIDPQLSLLVDPGYQDTYAALRGGFLVGGALLAVLAAVVATALLNVERRRDLLTLAAVGAPPTMRRRMAAVQALVIAALGTSVGAAAGFVPPMAYVLTSNRARVGEAAMHLTAPWFTLAVLVVVVPAASALIAGTTTRSRLPADRAAALAAS